MVVLPIINRGKIFNVEIKLKDAKKIRKGIKYTNVSESEVLVNGKTLSDSKVYNEDTCLDFIRFNFLHTNYNNSYLVTTRNSNDSSFYDVYEIKKPPKYVNDALDRLYNKVLINMRKEVPDKKNNGYYVSLDDLGFNKYLTDDKIEQLKSIVTSVSNTDNWPILFKQAGIADLADTIDFLNVFDCTVVPSSTIYEDVLVGLIESFSKVKTRDFKGLNRYYNMAKENTNVYKKIVNVNKFLYNQPYRLIQSVKQREKHLVRVRENEG